MSVAVKIISYNVHLFGGLSSVTLSGMGQVAKIIHDDEQRLAALDLALSHCGADIVCLQELWSDSYKGRLTRTLSHIYPYSYYQPFGDYVHLSVKQIGSGLLLLSKHPVVNANFTAFARLSGEDKFADKGVMCALVNVAGPDGLYPLVVVSTHTQAGTGEAAVQARSDNINDIVGALNRFKFSLPVADASRLPQVITGDLNVVAETRSGDHTGEYRILSRELGAIRFTDLAASLYPDRQQHPLFTSDPDRNSLIPLFDPDDHTPGRLDYLFTRNIAVEGSSFQVGLDWTYSGTQGAVDISDHYPISASIILTERT